MYVWSGGASWRASVLEAEGVSGCVRALGADRALRGQAWQISGACGFEAHGRLWSRPPRRAFEVKLMRAYEVKPRQAFEVKLIRGFGWSACAALVEAHASFGAEPMRAD
eukprot:274162-Chlamydomonas_euryale.AAC.1